MQKKGVKYSLWDNIKYVAAGIVTWQPLVLPLMVLHGLMAGLSTFVWLYAVKWIILFYRL